MKSLSLFIFYYIIKSLILTKFKLHKLCDTSYRSLNFGDTEFCLDYKTKYLIGQDSDIIKIHLIYRYTI